MKKVTLFATLFALLFACTTNELDNIASEVNNETTLSDLTAGFAYEDQTKTYVENGKYLRWHEADLIAAFYGNTLNRQYKFNGQTGANNGTFSLVPNGELGTGNDLGAIYAIYPYDDTATITDEGVISLTLPATQHYAEKSFGKGANTMIAVTENIEDTFLGFRNACGYLKLKLYNAEGVRIRSIEVKGNNEEKIVGSATATIEFGSTPELAMGEDATTTVTLDCGEQGVALGTTAETATEFWVVLPEVTFENGITISVTDELGGVFTRETNNKVAIIRNDIQPMAALNADVFEGSIPNNQIWYTATEKISPYKTGIDIFGANIVSNVWNSETGEGVIIFDGDVTKIGAYAFYQKKISEIQLPRKTTMIGTAAFDGCNLKSVNIPYGVTSIGSDAFRYMYMSEIIIPETVISIGLQAFYGSYSLKSVTIPQNVKHLGSGAFQDCRNLKNVYCKSSIPPSNVNVNSTAGGSNLFYNADSDLKIYIPATDNDIVIKLYQLTPGWDTYKDLFVEYDFEE